MEAGFELRQPGCSACLAMNDDKVPVENMPYLLPTETLKDVRDRALELSLPGHWWQLLLPLRGKLPIPENFYLKTFY
jgi:3-isopropylmalate/(R)-2-methylmalate dehydratase large subunit